MTYGVGGLRESFTVVANGKTYLNNQYSYNKLGYLTKVNSGNVEGHYSYDSNGNVTNVTYGNNSTASYTYNKADMVTEVKNKYNKTELSNFKYTYGSDGNVLTRTEGWGRNATVNYTYNGLNRLTQESQTGTYTFANTYAYDDYGNRQSVTDNNGVSINYTYDANNRLLSTTGGEVGTYTYDANGNLTQVTMGTGAAARTLNYTYDNFNRLKRVGDNATETVYTYDADGLRLSKTSNGTTEQYVYDGDQLVLTIAPTPDLVYSGTIPASGSADVPFGLSDGQEYFMEVDGKVYPVKVELNIEVVSPASDFDMADDVEDDEPLAMNVSPAGFATFVIIKAGGVSIISSDGGQRGFMEGPAGTTVKLYNTDPRKATTAYIRGLGLIASRTNGAATYYHYDAHGNVVQLTGAIGTVLKDYTYDAFGVEKGADDTDTNIFRYCGEQYDTETGNYYLRARYYTPGAGRFTQEDPAMDGLNWYAYCAGNPVAFVDPSGMQDVLLRYIAEKNNATIEIVQNKVTFLGFTIGYYGLDYVTVTIDGKSVQYDGELINRRMVVDSEQFGNDFGITDTTLLTHQPGDQFRSVDDAAIAWGLTYNQISIDNNVEYAGSICAANGRYVFNAPAQGSNDQSSINFPEDMTALKAIIHSHAAYAIGYDNENFSSADKQVAAEYKVPIYVSTPGGNLKKYNPDPWWENTSVVTDKMPKDLRLK